MTTLPYRAEYAKSGKSACKGCKQLIEDKSLRLAIMVQSAFFDGMQPNWYHSRCFFLRTRAKTVDEVGNFQNLRWADQEEIRSKIESVLNTLGVEELPSKPKKKGKGTKRQVTNDPSLPFDLADYTIEYAKSNRSKCKVCEVMINKGTVRISKKEYESETAKKYGPCDRWHHPDCFVRAREELQFFASGTVLPGYAALEPDDQTVIKDKLPPIKDAILVPPVPKKTKKEDSDLKKLMKTQNEAMFKMRDKLQALSKKELVLLLEHNKQDVPEGMDRILDRLADLMTFGNMERCPKCSTGQVIFKSGIGYQCQGYITDWSKCLAVYDQPKRTPFKIHKSLQAAYPFLASYKCKPETRAFEKSELNLTAVPSTSSATSSNGSVVANKPLSGLSFAIHKTTKPPKDLQATVEGLGGKISKTVTSAVLAVISVPQETARKKLLKIVNEAKTQDVAVVSEEFSENLTSTTTRAELIELLKKHTCSEWGADFSSKLPYDTVDGCKSVYPSKSAAAVNGSKSLFKSELGVQKLTLKDGLFVDPESKLVKKAHVYQRKIGQANEIYSVVLSKFDLQLQQNSFYKLQVLEADTGNRFWLFRSWGRIGTTIGGAKTEEYGTIDDACNVFERLFEEKTSNSWYNRAHFVKQPGKFMMLEVEHGSQANTKMEVDPCSSLAMPVQQLMTLIFDIEAMQKTMMEFELDLTKMPLGKLSKKQITSAYSLLTELIQIREKGADLSELIDRTNRFYTLVPHDFGIENPPLLDNEDLIKQKIQMLDNLLEIEIAYGLLQSTGSGDSPIDAHYKKLHTTITVLDKTSEEFLNIKKYVENTHAETHRNYSLIIEDVFKIEREGESARYNAFKKLHNKMLLWHGSRLTNYAGILSQGLRIAPPEAPVTGYMFGKGIYFADMVSKSANYCMTSRKDNTGLMLLCEVALGNMHELKNAANIVKPPKGKHSVKGIGVTQPNPNEQGKTPDGALIPYGKGVPTSDKGCSLLYNEYIVYDVGQVNIKYLLRMKFKY